METLDKPVGTPSATNDADNITLEGLGELLTNKENAQLETVEADVEQAETDAPATETEELPQGDELNEPEELSEPEETDDPEAQDADDEEESTGLNDKAQESVNKRIAKLTAKRKLADENRREAEQRSSELEAQNQKLQDQINKQGTEQLKVSDPLADVMSKKELKDKIKENRDWRLWALRNPNGGEMSFPDGKTQVYDEDQVEGILKYAEDNLNEHIPSREKWIDQNAQMKAVARQQFPAWNDSSDPLYAEYQQILQQLPEIKRFPHYEVLAGVFQMGLGMYNKQLEASNNKTPAKPKAQKVQSSTEPTKVSTPASAPPPAAASKGAAKVVDAEKYVDESNGSADAVMQLLKARRNAA